MCWVQAGSREDDPCPCPTAFCPPSTPHCSDVEDVLGAIMAAEDDLIASHRQHIEESMAAVREEMNLLGELDGSGGAGEEGSGVGWGGGGDQRVGSWGVGGWRRGGNQSSNGRGRVQWERKGKQWAREPAGC